MRAFLSRLLLFTWLALLLASPVYAATIVLDGQFNDWVGQPSIGDGQYDTFYWWYADLRNFYWTTDGTNAFFMAERWPPLFPTDPVYFFLQIDTNNNGQYNDPNDYWLLVYYKPKKNKAEVTVDLYRVDNTGTGIFQKNLGTKQNWGDSAKNGGARAEWSVAFADLGLTGNTAINMTLSTADVNWQGNNGQVLLLDSSAAVQWTPVDALGWPLLIVVALGGAWLLWRAREKMESTAPCPPP